MDMNGVGAAETLPYRTDPDQLGRWIEALARGTRHGLPAKTAEGTATSAAALGLATASGAELTHNGRDYALADPSSRPALLRVALTRVAAYVELGRAVRRLAAAGGRPRSEAQWIETWWATEGYGSSPSNRSEGVAALGRLGECAGLGRYVPGRRGHATRIEWDVSALDVWLHMAAARPPEPMNRREAVPREAPVQPPEAAAPPAMLRAVPPSEYDPERVGTGARGSGLEDEASQFSAGSEASPAARRTTAWGRMAARRRPGDEPPDGDEVNAAELALDEGRVARLSVPSDLTHSERRRIAALLDLLMGGLERA